MPHDRLVITLLAHDARRAWRSLSLSSALWIALGGGLLVAYAVADVWVQLIAQAAAFRGDAGLWFVRAPSFIAAIGAWLGGLTARAAVQRAFAPFLRALPIADASRRRMAVVAGVAVGVPLGSAAAVLVAIAAFIVGKPFAPVWGIGEASVGAVAFAIAYRGRLVAGMRGDGIRTAAPAKPRGPLLFGFGIVDGAPLPWLGSWAWGLSAGRVRLTFRLIALALPIAVIAAFAIAASLAQHVAAPAAVVALLGGLAVFMLSLRMAPLESPVLRTSSVTFGRAWRRLLRLPLMLSAGFFAVPAGAASAAEPSSAAARVADGVGLLVLDASYAVFAAYFSLSPLAGALAFFAAVLYALYEAWEFGGGMIIGFAALVAFLWARTRRRYING